MTADSGTAEPPVRCVRDFLGRDHARLDSLLERSLGEDGLVDREVYQELRRGLLQHIAMEEKVLIPAVRQADPDDVEHVANLLRLRRDHGRIAHLLTIEPQPFVIKELAGILGPHNALEEDEHGLYGRADALGRAEAERLVAEMKAVAPVKVAPFRRG